MLDITNVATNTTLNAKINEVQNKILNITNLAISQIENEITIDHDHDKSITTQEFNRLRSEIFTAKLSQAKLASKCDTANLVKRQILMI